MAKTSASVILAVLVIISLFLNGYNAEKAGVDGMLHCFPEICPNYNCTEFCMAKGYTKGWCLLTTGMCCCPDEKIHV
ncbi:unnamed protein product [Lathyrus oleraceus]